MDFVMQPTMPMLMNAACRKQDRAMNNSAELLEQAILLMNQLKMQEKDLCSKIDASKNSKDVFLLEEIKREEYELKHKFQECLDQIERLFIADNEC
jgi:hypothetical protein